MATELVLHFEWFLYLRVLQLVPSAAASLYANRVPGRQLVHALQSRAFQQDVRMHTECSSQDPAHCPPQKRGASPWQSSLQCQGFAARSPVFLKRDTRKCESAC